MTLNLVMWWLEPGCWAPWIGSGPVCLCFSTYKQTVSLVWQQHFGTSSLWAFLVCAVVDQVTSQREDWRYMIHLRADLKKQWKYMFVCFFIFEHSFTVLPSTPAIDPCYRPLLYFWYTLYIHTHLSTSQHSTSVYIMRTTWAVMD